MTTWLPQQAVFDYLADNKYRNFAEILGATGDQVQHERASRLYMSSGVGYKKKDDGTEEVVSLEELQERSGLTLAEIIRKGRRRAIQLTLAKLVDAGAIECKDLTIDSDLREYKMLNKDWKPKRRGDKSEQFDKPEPLKDQQAKPKRQKRQKPEDEILEPEESMPKVPFEMPKHVRDLLEEVDYLEMGFPMAFKSITNGDRNDFARLCREMKRIIVTNIFVPAPLAVPTVQPPAPAAPAPAPTPSVLPKPPASNPLCAAGSATE